MRDECLYVSELSSPADAAHAGPPADLQPAECGRALGALPDEAQMNEDTLLCMVLIASTLDAARAKSCADERDVSERERERAPTEASDRVTAPAATAPSSMPTASSSSPSSVQPLSTTAGDPGSGEPHSELLASGEPLGEPLEPLGEPLGPLGEPGVGSLAPPP